MAISLQARPWPTSSRLDCYVARASPTIEMAILAPTCWLARNVAPQPGAAFHAASRRRKGSTTLAYMDPN